jgi:hypothetical protein
VHADLETPDGAVPRVVLLRRTYVVQIALQSVLGVAMLVVGLLSDGAFEVAGGAAWIVGAAVGAGAAYATGTSAAQRAMRTATRELPASRASPVSWTSADAWSVVLAVAVAVAVVAWWPSAVANIGLAWLVFAVLFGIDLRAVRRWEAREELVLARLARPWGNRLRRPFARAEHVGLRSVPVRARAAAATPADATVQD